MKPRTEQINIRFTDAELAELDRISRRPDLTGLQQNTRAAVVRAALAIYLGAYRANGEPPNISEAIAALTQPGKPELPPQNLVPIAHDPAGNSMPEPIARAADQPAKPYSVRRRGSSRSPSAP